MKRTYILLISFLIFFQLQLIAEEEEVFGVILYAEGQEITVYQNDGSVEILNIADDDVIGEPLYEGESIETDDYSTVEIQVYPSNNILKLSESTALTLESMGESSGGSIFSLIYGSIRAKIEKILGDDSFDIHTGDAVAGVRGADFVVNYLYDETEEAYTIDVLCFEGEIEVHEQDETDGSERFRIGPDEQMSVRRPQPGGPLAFNQKPLPDDRKEFWHARDFRKAPIGPGLIEDHFSELRKKLQNDDGLRRLPPAKRNQPGFQRPIPQRPMPGQMGNPPPQQQSNQLPLNPQPRRPRTDMQLDKPERDN